MANKDGRTEKATGKRRSEARGKGQVVKSAEINSVVVLLAAAAALAITGPKVVMGLAGMLSDGLQAAGHPGHAAGGLGGEAGWALTSFAKAVAPIAIVCLLAGLAANVAQVRLRWSTHALKLDIKKISPLGGLKRLFGKNGAVEALKALVKTVLIGGVAFSAVWPQMPQLGALVGLPPWSILTKIGGIVLGMVWRVGGVLIVIAVLDYLWQRHRHEESLKMTKEEVKQEGRQQDVAPEVKGAIRRKQIEQARKRMLAEVPTADVVVVNPTHYAVALRYDGKVAAPEVIAKGVDLIAAAIRRVADENDVPIVTNPPLARTLYREVELGQMIPEGLYQAVAEVLAFVFRTSGRRVAERRRRALRAESPAA